MSSVVRNFIVTFCASLLIFGIIAYVILSNVGAVFGDSPVAADPSESSPPSDGIDDDTSDGANEGDETDASGEGGETAITDSFTFLLIGTDYMPETHTDYDVTALNSSGTGFPIKAREISADSLILVHCDSAKKIFMFTTLPSDMRVTIDGGQTTLSRAYAKKGADFTARLVTAMTGIPVDYYALTSLEGFAKLIDSVGGVTFTVPTDMSYTDESEPLVIDIKRGNQTLDGVTAADMLRYVNYTDGDSSRRAMAVTFAKSLLKKLAIPTNMPLASQLYNDYAQYVETNFTLTDLAAHLDLIFSYGDYTSIDLTYPGLPENDGGIIDFVPDLDAAITLYKDYR